MPQRNAVPMSWSPRGLTDSLDGTTSFQGAMKVLQNVIPAPSTAHLWQPRPAAQRKTNFTGADAPLNAGEISARLIVGDLEYGMVPSTLNNGFDEPYAYSLANDLFIAVLGITASNVPESPPATGDWTPPIMAVVGGRIIVTHPGFPGGAVKFGWFDISGFSVVTTGNTTTSTLITGNPSILGVQPGMTVTGTGIPAGAVAVSTAEVALVQAGDTHTSTLIDNLPVSAARAVGQLVGGAGVPIGATVTILSSSTSVTISAATTSTVAANPTTFTGATITLSAATVGSANGVALTIAGGTRAAPLWGAGDCDRNPLLSTPLGVAQMGGRAWFADGFDGIPWSDSGFACRRTSPTQALLTNDGLEVTALGQLQLSAALPGGVVQGLIAFEGVNKLQQILGDPALNTLTMNVLPEATGTDAPLSIVPIGTGKLAFVAPLGLRTVGLDGVISQPVGADGQGITQPFQFAEHPSRICAAYNVGVLRVSVQNSIPDGNPFEEYWLDMARGIWHGPHTFPARLIQPWRSTFVTTPVVVGSASLWQSDAFSNNFSSYIENGARLSWIMRSVLLPDNAQVAMNAIVVSNLACVGSVVDPLAISALDEAGVIIDSVTIPATAGNRIFRQRPIDWSRPLIFKQMSVRVTGPSESGVLVGTQYALYEPLGYPPDDTEPPFYLLSSRTPFPILLADDGSPLFPG